MSPCMGVSGLTLIIFIAVLNSVGILKFYHYCVLVYLAKDVMPSGHRSCIGVWMNGSRHHGHFSLEELVHPFVLELSKCLLLAEGLCDKFLSQTLGQNLEALQC